MAETTPHPFPNFAETPQDSSGVLFFPKSTQGRYWRIGNVFYDLEPFLDKHPGGRKILELARDRFEDSTFAFEAHHTNAPKVREALEAYRVPDNVIREYLKSRGYDNIPLSSSAKDPLPEFKYSTKEDSAFRSRAKTAAAADSFAPSSPRSSPTERKPHVPSSFGVSVGNINHNLAVHSHYPSLTDKGSFFWVVRERVHKHLQSVGGPGPTMQAKVLFFICLAWWFITFLLTAHSPTASRTQLVWAMLNALAGAWMGGFGHNWVHQPKYRTWAYCLDLVGLSSEQWIREHCLQHHMLTNTPLDNHWEGTAPFLIVDPTKHRAWWQTLLLVPLHQVILFFGPIGNYTIHLIGLFKGNETFSIGKLFLPMEFAYMMYHHGLLVGLLLPLLGCGVMGCYYFTIALANHNTKAAWNVDGRNQATDWAQTQLHTCSDIYTGLSFLQSMPFLWLNYHTTHHLFPHTDMSKHPGIQRVVLDTCAEFGIPFSHHSFPQMYWEMLQTFVSPRALGKEIVLYSGG